MSSARRGRAVSPFDIETPQPCFIWAHRGASALAPENSMEAFQLAFEFGADGIEFDVQLSSDGIPVVIHDPFLFSDGATWHLRPPVDAKPEEFPRIFVGSCTWAELSSSPVHFPDGAISPLVRLEEVLESVPESLWLDVELKAGWTYDPRLARVVAACLSRRSEATLVSSFDHVVLAELHARMPNLPLAALCDARLVDAAAVLANIPSKMLNVRRAFVTRGDVESLRKIGIAVSVYGGEILFDLPDMLSWPVAGIFLDDPSMAFDAHLAEDFSGHS
ncbi:MAG TPA: glycerophosphodiester phosphodiesterase [Acidimicrobiales bacterium]|nr:glycerophosphodiester phosphodiesterase [Acidimicrobiales bacterium]